MTTVRQPERPTVIVALDYDRVADAERLVDRLDPTRCRLKVGKELFLRGGPDMVGRWVDAGWEVFLDLKFHDIPNTVAAACRAAADLGVWMVNVHALGGGDMLRAARQALGTAGRGPWLIAVTVLTSHDASTLGEVGVAGTPAEAVARLGQLAADCGVDGVVCSAWEAEGIRSRHGSSFRRVTPGIRPAGSAAGDQSRVMTPRHAVLAGATDLVVGRPITRAADPSSALDTINREIDDTIP